MQLMTTQGYIVNLKIDFVTRPSLINYQGTEGDMKMDCGVSLRQAFSLNSRQSKLKGVAPNIMIFLLNSREIKKFPHQN